MTIGPEAARMASGRLVVLGVSFGIVGGLTTLLGIGLLTSGGDGVWLLGLPAILAGAVLAVGCGGLLLRPRWGRRAGVIAAFVLTMLGLVLLWTGADAVVLHCLGDEAPRAAPDACATAGAISAIGLFTSIMGAVGARFVRRARRSYFERGPDQKSRRLA